MISQVVRFRCPLPLLRRIVKAADSENRTVSNWIKAVILAALEKKENCNDTDDAE